MGGFRTAKSNPAVVATAVRDDGERAVVDGSSDGAVRISRREVVTGGVAVAALLALGGTGVALAGERQLLRPPGRPERGAFMGACIKCDRCRSACPHGAIDVAHLEDGIVNARTPKMNFRKGFCDFCLPDGAHVAEGAGAVQLDPLCVRPAPRARSFSGSTACPVATRSAWRAWTFPSAYCTARDRAAARSSAWKHARSVRCRWGRTAV